MNIHRRNRLGKASRLTGHNFLVAIAGAALIGGGDGAAIAQSKPPMSVSVDADGTVHVPAMSVPASDFLSPAGKAYLKQHLRGQEGQAPFLETFLARQREEFALLTTPKKIGGVEVIEFVPKDGVSKRNTKRILINLHGGGFGGCWSTCAELESRPVASVGRVRVVTVNYREWPEGKFPDASEDVATVYRELLKTYRPQNIGIYGCSAGGELVGMEMAWFRQHNLPKPGAVGIFCAGAALPNRQPISGFGGDAESTAFPTGEAHMPPPATGVPPVWYFNNASLRDPLVVPLVSDDVMAWFPPTLVLTGTRAFDLSSAVYTHTQLVKHGVDAQLYLQDGMFHAFFYNPDTPESHDAYTVMTRFFDRHLGH